MRIRTVFLCLMASYTMLACGASGGGGTPDVAAPDAVTPADVDPADVSPDVPVDTWEAPPWGTQDFFRVPEVADDGVLRLTILHTNDLHAHFDGNGPLLDYSPSHTDDDATIGGFARLAGRIERERRALRPGEGLVVLDAGDYSMGSAYTALWRTVGAELKLLDRLGYTATTLGNHEFEWGPAATAEFLTAGLADVERLRVLSANLVFSEEDPADDALAALVAEGRVAAWHVETLDNGMKVGLFGLICDGAMKLAPAAAPVTIRSPSEVAQETVDHLRNVEGVDVVVALTHCGTGEGSVQGADEKLAAAVTGLDVIVGGHSHTRIDPPHVVNGTLVLQSGQYGQSMGRLTLARGAEGFALESYALLPVDDTVPGDPEVTGMLREYAGMLAEAAFEGLGLGYRDAVCATAFDLAPAELVETNLGDFVSDAVRWAASAAVPDEPVDFAFEANGVIRDGIFAGTTGRVALGDLIRVLPLGTGPDGALGYPLLSVYLTAPEVKTALEIIAGLAALVSDTFYLNVSGLRFTYDATRPTLQRVTAIYPGDDVAGYADTPLDMSAANPKLYRIAVNLYIAEMLGALQGMTGGLLAIVPKDAEGTPLPQVTAAIIDRDPATAGVQEVKLWRALVDYARTFPTDEATGLPTIPARYAQPAGRAAALP